MGVRVLIVDDHGSFRAWARVLLERSGYAVAGEAGDAASAVEAARVLRPEVALIDVQLPDGDGFQLAERLRAGGSGPEVVLTSTREACDYGERLAESCALGFVPKSELSGESLARVLRAGDDCDSRDGGRTSG